MGDKFQQFKPGVPRTTHLLLAALLWTAVGIGLGTRGTLWLAEGGGLFLAVPAVVAGSVKSFFLLDKSATKSIDRIQHLRDGSCLGAVYSWRTWLLVLGMMAMGMVLRRSPLPLVITGALYLMIGWALLLSSRLAWKAWRGSH